MKSLIEQGKPLSLSAGTRASNATARIITGRPHAAIRYTEPLKKIQYEIRNTHDRYVAVPHLRICSGPVCRRAHARIYEIQSAHAGGRRRAASHGQRTLQHWRQKPHVWRFLSRLWAVLHSLSPVRRVSGLAPGHNGQKHSARDRSAGLGVLRLAGGGPCAELEIFCAAANNIFRCAGDSDWLGGVAGWRDEGLSFGAAALIRCAEQPADIRAWLEARHRIAAARSEIDFRRI